MIRALERSGPLGAGGPVQSMPGLGVGRGRAKSRLKRSGSIGAGAPSPMITSARSRPATIRVASSAAAIPRGASSITRWMTCRKCAGCDMRYPSTPSYVASNISGLQGYLSPFTPVMIQSPGVTSCPCAVFSRVPILYPVGDKWSSITPSGQTFECGSNCSASITTGFLRNFIELGRRRPFHATGDALPRTALKPHQSFLKMR